MFWDKVKGDYNGSMERWALKLEAAHQELRLDNTVDFKYADALDAADNIQTFKLIVKTIAMKAGLCNLATFMPKPISGINGNGMHTNMSLFNEDGNVFYDEAGDLQLSKTAYNFLGGVLAHAANFTAITNPTVNSYKRLTPGFEAPVYVAWSGSNRSPMVRVPASRGNSTRLELRSVDPTANPYLAFAVILAAGLDGVAGEMEPNHAVDRNIYLMDEAERKKAGITDLPDTLLAAVNDLDTDSVIKEALGSHMARTFVDAKRLEYQAYRQEVSQWELETYLEQY